MKKLIMLMSFGLILVTGCSKEGTSDQIEQEKSIETADVVLIYKADGTNSTWEANFDGETMVYGNGSTTASTNGNRGESAHTHGSTPYFTFSGTQNNGGTHGSATVDLGFASWTLETECVMVEGNEAVYGGIITEAINPPPFGAGKVGDFIYFKVFDNGQGSNADPDQFHGFIRFYGTSRCGVVTPSSGAWPPTFFGFPMIIDIEAPGSVKVNN